MFCEMVPRKHVKNKTKQLCCGDEFSEYVKAEVSKPLASARVLVVEQIKRNIDDRIE